MSAEHVSWCDLGCGAELVDRQLTDEGRCPKDGRLVVDLGWRWYGSRHEVHYASDWKTVPQDQK
jgi:hypothetical protein